jgi:hypothetical protein
MPGYNPTTNYRRPIMMTGQAGLESEKFAASQTLP